jgi:hypothetical protein
MALLLGPVLLFRGARDRSLDLSALAGVAGEEAPPPLGAGEELVPPHRLAGRCGRSLWRYDFSLPVGDERGSEYRIGQRSWRVHLPTRALAKA